MRCSGYMHRYEEPAMKTKTNVKAGQGMAAKSLDEGIYIIWDDID